MANSTSCNGLKIGLGVVNLGTDNGMLDIKREERAGERKAEQTRQARPRRDNDTACLKVSVKNLEPRHKDARR